ncbi:helicase [Cryptosporidium muris RN66]|uniref:Helicase conserved C-terminal domain-containing protein n=1 Tax=Cryptosporidium muris (strain RN66) TaxID=441375 RepID=B6AIK0_CRYMR|nr:helicase [Cryptosporidium muris RN66]EEA08041.1 helicase conserved C-terminal domain-containing protein [Cryptosporidium muris RN66]|eukprot:XP_002142390.1 helicase [Cryptosporidium muris RN66]
MEILDIGKHKGKTFQHIEKVDPGYARWVLSIDNPTNRSLIRFANYLREKSESFSTKKIDNGMNSNNSYIITNCKGIPSLVLDYIGTNISDEKLEKKKFDCNKLQNNNIDNENKELNISDNKYTEFNNNNNNNINYNECNNGDFYLLDRLEKEIDELMSGSTIIANGLTTYLTPKKPKIDCTIILSMVSPTMFRISVEQNQKISFNLPRSLSNWLNSLNLSEVKPVTKKMKLYHSDLNDFGEKNLSGSYIYSGLYYERIYDSIMNSFECKVESIPDFIFECFPNFKLARETHSATPKYIKDEISVSCNNCIGCHTNSICMNSLSFLKEEFPKLYGSLRPFQCVGILFGLKNNGRLLIGDEMGLGKTLQALSLISYYQSEWPVLIICPSSIRFQWYQQSIEWLNPTINKSNVILIRNSNDKYHKRAKIIIISYDLLVRNEYFRKFLNVEFNVIIADESHFLKNSMAKRTQIIIPLLHNAKRAILLSGTPALNHPTELYEQINVVVNQMNNLINDKRNKKLIKGKIMNDNINRSYARCPLFLKYLDFAHRYSDVRINKFSRKKEFYGSRNTEELHLFLRQCVMIRRLKKQVLHELPPKLRSKVPLEIKDKNGLKRIQEILNDENYNNNEDINKIQKEQYHNKEFDDDLNVNMCNLHKLTCQVKIEAVQEYIEYMLDNNDDKFVIFGHHHEMLDAIETILVKRKRNKSLSEINKHFVYIRIDGKTPGNKREEYVKEFQNNINCKVAVLSITACGQGLNLTSAGTVIFAELYWVPGFMLQAEDRCHRMGTQYSCINIHYLVAENTLDDKMWGILYKKQKIMASTLDGIDHRKSSHQHFITN